MKRKISKALAKRIIEFAQEIEKLHCQKYSSGKCSDFSGNFAFLEPEVGLDKYCSACQIREGVILMKRGAERYKPEQILF
jgi:hypothetical protein